MHRFALCKHRTDVSGHKVVVALMHRFKVDPLLQVTFDPHFSSLSTVHWCLWSFLKASLRKTASRTPHCESNDCRQLDLLGLAELLEYVQQLGTPLQFQQGLAFQHLLELLLPFTGDGPGQANNPQGNIKLKGFCISAI